MANETRSSSAEIEVAVASRSMNWMMQLTSDLQRFEPHAYRSYDVARAEARASAGMVIVLGPPDTRDAIAAGVPFTGTGFVVVGVVENTDTETRSRAAEVGFADLIVAADTARLISTVDQLSDGWATRGVAAPELPVIGPVDGRLVVVTSARAGQGTTSVAANVALILARTHLTVLAEGDPRFGDLIDAFGVRDGQTVLQPSAIQTLHEIGNYIHRDPSGLHLLVLPSAAGSVLDVEAMINLIGLVEKLCEVLVVDVPLWVLERFPLHRIADDVLLVTTDSDRDLRRATLAMEVLGLTAASERIIVREADDQVVSPQSDEVASRLEEVARWAEESVGAPAFAVLPRDDAALRADENARPVVEVAPLSDLAQAFESLTDRLLEEWREA